MIHPLTHAPQLGKHTQCIVAGGVPCTPVGVAMRCGTAPLGLNSPAALPREAACSKDEGSPCSGIDSDSDYGSTRG